MSGTDIFALLNRAPRQGEPGFSDYVEALEAYTDADKACDKAHDAWQVARQRLLARQEALERIIDAAAPVLRDMQGGKR